MRISVSGMGSPTVSKLTALSRWMQEMPAISVCP
jgi:hypothetical protein